MQLKDYQTDVLESLSRYLRVLSARREEAEEVLEFQRSKGRDAKLVDYCREGMGGAPRREGPAAGQGPRRQCRRASVCGAEGRSGTSGPQHLPEGAHRRRQDPAGDIGRGADQHGVLQEADRLRLHLPRDERS